MRPVRSVPGAAASRLRRGPRRARHWAWNRRIATFRKRYLTEPAPLDRCLALQASASAALGIESPLLPAIRNVEVDGSAVRDRALSRYLNGEIIGDWSVTSDTVDWLVGLMERKRPRVVLEFGSGVSTLCFCVVLSRIHGPDSFRLLSIEQDAEYCERTTSRIQGVPGAESCRVLHVPLVADRVADHTTWTYDLGAVEPRHFQWAGDIDFVFIDGPAAEGPCRYGTLPAVRNRLSRGALFAMDDALRWKELLVADLWRRERLVIDGVLTIGEGVLIGSDAGRREGHAIHHGTSREGR